MASSLVIGMGQIGTAVKAVTESEHSYDLEGKWSVLDSGIDIMHICFPYSSEFEEQVRTYIVTFKPKHIAIWSTVPIGTCNKINPRIVHTPVEGKHPDLELSIRQMPRWIGANDSVERQFFANYFGDLGLQIRPVESSDFTEFLKLRSTSKYGVNLVWTDYEKKIADSIEMPFELLKEFDRDYNKLYRNLGMDWAQRYVLDAPDGKIGGHCVKPNAVLLNKEYPHEMLKMITAMGDPE